MKVSTLVLLLVVCGKVIAVHNSAFSGMETKLGRQIADLQKTKLGKLFFEFAELSLMTTGAVEALVDGIKSFGQQIEDRLDKEIDTFDQMAAAHNSKTLELQSLISQAELDINREKKRLNQELIPRTEELDEILNNLKDKKENNKKQVEDSNAVREDQHAAFVDETNNLTEAVRGVDESLELIEEMEHDGSVKAAFLEVSTDHKKKIAKILKQVKANTEKFGRQYSSFVQALTQLFEGENFKDRQVFKEMKDNLNALRGNFQETIQVAYAAEAQQIENYEKQLKQLQEEEEVFDQAYAQAYQEREDKGIRISDLNTFVSTREQDQKSYEERLTLENNTFAANHKIHDDLVVEINDELALLEKVLDTVQSPPFKEFLAGKMAY